ncbi:MAG: NAD(P)/FAD-dependent oxidoreductase [Candidatus Omnitrophica bacterium]|nr:NAD(P)/FAD-dependent oxidoreductase [Candidatus Omnitrophota bacterium]
MNPTIVIIGGGFAGVRLARDLKGQVDVLLVDQNNYHTFQPLLYQVATSALESDSIVYPFREIFHNRPNVRFRLAQVLQIVPEANRITTSIGEIDYDYLVLAAGSKTNYFGDKDFEAHTHPMKSVPEAGQLRNIILENMERALGMDWYKRSAVMNIVVVGGGPTGVEMAGALAELKNKILPKDYPELDFQLMQIHVVDMADRLLNTMAVESSNYAARFLRKNGIHLSLAARVVSYDGQSLMLSNGQQILTQTVIWAAGVTATVIPGINPQSVLPSGRLKVNAFNQLEGYENIFALGDMAGMITDQTPKGHPMLAPIAIQQAKHLAQNIQRLLKKKPLVPFVYKDPGVMATIGRNHAVAELKFIRLHGTLAWLAWLFVHLMSLVGFRNRAIVFFNWMWSYVTYNRSLRLILKPLSK